jgi:hypothetical protein
MKFNSFFLQRSGFCGVWVPVPWLWPVPGFRFFGSLVLVGVWVPTVLSYDRLWIRSSLVLSRGDIDLLFDRRVLGAFAGFEDLKQRYNDMLFDSVTVLSCLTWDKTCSRLHLRECDAWLLDLRRNFDGNTNSFFIVFARMCCMSTALSQFGLRCAHVHFDTNIK